LPEAAGAHPSREDCVAAAPRISAGSLLDRGVSTRPGCPAVRVAGQLRLPTAGNRGLSGHDPVVVSWPMPAGRWACGP
jgi:hypothetical protein